MMTTSGSAADGVAGWLEPLSPNQRPSKSDSRSALCRTSSCLADQKNRKADHIRNYCHADDFGRENQPTRNIDDWIDSEEDRQQGDNEAADRGDSQPKSCILSHSARAGNRDSEQNEINDSIENVGGIVHELKCLLDPSADLACYRDYERDGAHEKNRIDRRFVAGV